MKANIWDGSLNIRQKDMVQNEFIGQFIQQKSFNTLKFISKEIIFIYCLQSRLIFTWQYLKHVNFKLHSQQFSCRADLSSNFPISPVSRKEIFKWTKKKLPNRGGKPVQLSRGTSLLEYNCYSVIILQHNIYSQN